jgi:hypothetical protein
MTQTVGSLPKNSKRLSGASNETHNRTVHGRGGSSLNASSQAGGHRRTHSLPSVLPQYCLLGLNLRPLCTPQATSFSLHPSTSSDDGLADDEMIDARIEMTTATPTTPAGGGSTSLAPATSTRPDSVASSTAAVLPEQVRWDAVHAVNLPVGPSLNTLVEHGIPDRYRSFVWHVLINGYVGRERTSRGAG